MSHVHDPEQIKHIADAVTIPAGLAAGYLHWIELANVTLTFIVLLTSAVYGVYRVIDLHKKYKEG